MRHHWNHLKALFKAFRLPAIKMALEFSNILMVRLYIAICMLQGLRPNQLNFKLDAPFIMSFMAIKFSYNVFLR